METGKVQKALRMVVRWGFVVAIASILLFGSGCSESDVAMHNVSKAAHNFEVKPTVYFYNGITGEYILVIEGGLSVKEDSTQNRLEVIVKTGEETYKKHYLGLSDNVSYFVEQQDPLEADPFHYRVFFRPQSIIPDVDFQAQ